MRRMRMVHGDQSNHHTDARVPEQTDELQRDLAHLRQRIWRTRDTCDMRRARQIELRLHEISQDRHG